MPINNSNLFVNRLKINKNPKLICRLFSKNITTQLNNFKWIAQKYENHIWPQTW